MKIFLFIWHLPRNIAGLFVVAYQKTISPDHGWLRVLFPHGYCKFEPSCSEYARQSLRKRGFIIGSVKSVWRFLRCNPWSKGGEDRA